MLSKHGHCIFLAAVSGYSLQAYALEGVFISCAASFLKLSPQYLLSNRECSVVALSGDWLLPGALIAPSQLPARKEATAFLVLALFSAELQYLPRVRPLVSFSALQRFLDPARQQLRKTPKST